MYRRLFLLALAAWSLVAWDVPTFAQAKAAQPKAAPKAAAPAAAAAAPAAKAPELVLGKLASDECVAFLATNGWKKPDPNSTNKSEKLWAEQSVQDFIEQFSDNLKELIDQQAEGDEEKTLAAATVPVLLKAAISHPLAISLVSFTVDQPPQIKLAVVIDTEADADEVREAFEKLVDETPEEGLGSLDEETIEGATFYRPEVPPQAAGLAPQFGMYKSYVILTMGPEMTAETIKKINGNGKVPAWLDSTLRDLKIDRPGMVWNVNIASILKTVDPLITEPKVRDALEASGLLGLKRLAAVTGLDAVGSVDKVVIETNGAPTGVLALIPNKPLTSAELKGVPLNVAQATVMRFDLEYMIEGILKIADKVDPMPRQQFDAISIQGEQILGFSIKDDLLKSFGDVWSMYVSGSEPGAGLAPGLVMTVSVRDQKKLTKVHDSLVSMAKGYLQQMGPQAPVNLEEFKARGTKGQRLQINNLPIPVAPSWVVTKDQFVFGLTPQLVTAHLGATNAKSLADNEDVKAGLKREPKALMISYRDPKPEVQGLYTIVNMFSPVVLGQLKQQGIDFNLPPLPPYSDIEQYLAPSVGTFAQTPNGWRSENHGVVPSMSAATPAVAAVAAALLLPAVQQAREAARRAQAKNNLKMIGLAMHNYHDTFRNFPERVVKDKNDKPGLSWRVKLLPFLDQAALYNEFHLDEPWDSEHNKTLIERMPPAFQSPNDPDLNQEGKTRYLVLDGEGTLFEGEEGPKISQITDGTSNTIMVVEANPESAVIWTAPDDLEVDFEDLLAGLEGSRTGGFHVLMCDGAVRFVSEHINVDILKALMTKAGGEVIGNF